MRAFLITLLVCILITGAAAYYLYQNAGSLQEGTLAKRVAVLLKPEPPEIPPRAPVDYHILQDQGGVPEEEALRAGLATDEYAYLRTMQPIQISKGVAEVKRATVRGLSYGFCYRFETTPPQEQHLEMNLGGRWGELHFGFGFDDQDPYDPERDTSIQFEILADGEQVFFHESLTPNDKPIFASIPVAGVNRVLFTSRRIGYNNAYSPVLIDPFVKAGDAGE
ncbi:NPCBM/NEW2 domain-containing protein [bacterium]|nr:NPCBM/NEW2 domain-containing protein [bacterium]